MLNPGDHIVLTPAELVPGGASLSRVDGFPVFVMNLYPGDQAVVRISEVKRGFARGELVELKVPGPLRRTEPCPVAEECGGCDWTALRLDHQLEAKKSILLESLRRVGKVDASATPAVTVHSAPLNYRMRSRLQVQHGKVGFFALQSHKVVPLPEECEVVGPAVTRNLAEIRATAAEVRNGEIRTLETAAEFRFTVSRPQQITIEVDDFRYTVSTETFFQVNRHLLRTLIDLVRRCAGGAEGHDRAFDLFSGVGFFTLPLSRLFKEVIGVEEAGLSHQMSLENAREYPNCRFVAARVERFLTNAPRSVDFILMDPPRAGISADALEGVSRTKTKLLCYLSCDPVTFARDTSRLLRRGWTLQSLDLIDLFPNTHHVETFAFFIR